MLGGLQGCAANTQAIRIPRPRLQVSCRSPAEQIEQLHQIEHYTLQLPAAHQCFVFGKSQGQPPPDGSCARKPVKVDMLPAVERAAANQVHIFQPARML